jgi:hypothetical protein
MDVKAAKVEGKTARPYTSAEFVDLRTVLANKAQRAKAVHTVLDNLSAHKTAVCSSVRLAAVLAT